MENKILEAILHLSLQESLQINEYHINEKLSDNTPLHDFLNSLIIDGKIDKILSTKDGIVIKKNENTIIELDEFNFNQFFKIYSEYDDITKNITPNDIEENILEKIDTIILWKNNEEYEKYFKKYIIKNDLIIKNIEHCKIHYHYNNSKNCGVKINLLSLTDKGYEYLQKLNKNYNLIIFTKIKNTNMNTNNNTTNNIVNSNNTNINKGLVNSTNIGSSKEKNDITIDSSKKSFFSKIFKFFNRIFNFFN